MSGSGRKGQFSSEFFSLFYKKTGIIYSDVTQLTPISSYAGSQCLRMPVYVKITMLLNIKPKEFVLVSFVGFYKDPLQNNITKGPWRSLTTVRTFSESV